MTKSKKTNSPLLPTRQEIDSEKADVTDFCHEIIDSSEELTPAQKSYWKSLHKLVIEAEKYFWSQNELTRKDGAREAGCPPNYVRSKIPRNQFKVKNDHIKTDYSKKYKFRIV